MRIAPDGSAGATTPFATDQPSKTPPSTADIQAAWNDAVARAGGGHGSGDSGATSTSAAAGYEGEDSVARREAAHRAQTAPTPPAPSLENRGGSPQSGGVPSTYDPPLYHQPSILDQLASLGQEALSGLNSGAGVVVKEAKKAKDLVTAENMAKLGRHAGIASWVLDGVDVAVAWKEEGHLGDHTLRTLFGDVGGELGGMAGSALGAEGGGAMAAGVGVLTGPVDPAVAAGGALLGALGGGYIGGEAGKQWALNLYDDYRRSHG